MCIFCNIRKVYMFFLIPYILVSTKVSNIPTTETELLSEVIQSFQPQANHNKETFSMFIVNVYKKTDFVLQFPKCKLFFFTLRFLQV